MAAVRLRSWQMVGPVDVAPWTPEEVLSRRRPSPRAVSRPRTFDWNRLGALVLALIAVVALAQPAWNAFGSDVYAAVAQAGMDAGPYVLVEDPTVAAPPPQEMAPAPGPVEVAPLGAPGGVEAGEALGTISAPAIGLEATFVWGVGRSDLKKGPGWMPQTAFPGDPGNAVISGHRTTYGAPFNRIDELSPGDRITVAVPGRKPAVYEVRETRIVKPGDVWVAMPTDGARLTLTTCHPEGSAKERLVVQAELVSGHAAAVALPADGWEFSKPS